MKPTATGVVMTMARERVLGRSRFDDVIRRQPVAVLRRTIARAVGLFRCWRERERERQELASMSPLNFGDVTVSPGLVREELRRWPWQGWSSEWLAMSRHGFDRDRDAQGKDEPSVRLSPTNHHARAAVAIPASAASKPMPTISEKFPVSVTNVTFAGPRDGNDRASLSTGPVTIRLRRDRQNR